MKIYYIILILCLCLLFCMYYRIYNSIGYLYRENIVRCDVSGCYTKTIDYCNFMYKNSLHDIDCNIYCK